MVASLPGRTILAVPSVSTISPSGTSPLLGVERLVLAEDHRIGIAHRRRHQADHIGRRRRRHDLEAGDHHAPVLDALRMLRAEPRARAVAGADHQRALGLPVAHIAALRKLIGDVVEADREEVREHDLRDRLEAGHRRAHRGAHDRLLGDRRIAHPKRAELLVKSDGRLEHAARLGHILAEEHDVGVALHLLRDATDHRIAIRQFRHAQPPSAYTSVVRISADGGGDALHASVASSTTRITSVSTLATASSPMPNCFKPLAIDLDRIALFPLLQFAFRPVLRRIGARVATVAIGHALDQRRTAAAARLGEGGLRNAVDRVGVLAVDDDPFQAVGASAIGRRMLHRGHIADRRVFHIEIVLADEHDRQLPDRGEVERLMERSDIGGAVAKKAD